MAFGALVATRRLSGLGGDDLGTLEDTSVDWTPPIGYSGTDEQPTAFGTTEAGLTAPRGGSPSSGPRDPTPWYQAAAEMFGQTLTRVTPAVVQAAPDAYKAYLTSGRIDGLAALIPGFQARSTLVPIGPPVLTAPPATIPWYRDSTTLIGAGAVAAGVAWLATRGRR